MLNNITIGGRFVRDPETRMTQQQKPVTTFTLACERDFSPQGQERQTDFVDFVCFDKVSDFVSKYFRKGSLAIVTGRLQIRDWTDREGNKRRNAEIIVDHAYFGESKKPSADVIAADWKEAEGTLPF